MRYIMRQSIRYKSIKDFSSERGEIPFVPKVRIFSFKKIFSFEVWKSTSQLGIYMEVLIFELRLSLLILNQHIQLRNEEMNRKYECVKSNPTDHIKKQKRKNKLRILKR